MRNARWLIVGVFLIALALFIGGTALLRRVHPMAVIPETPTVAVAQAASPTPPTKAQPTPTLPLPPTPPTARPLQPTPTATLYVISEVTIARQYPSPTPQTTGTPQPTPLPKAIGRIQIPALGHDYPIVPVSWKIKVIDGQPVAMWETVKGAVGHIRASAGLGQPGNTVLTGHTRGDGKGEFQNLWNLKPGDEIRLYDAEGNLYLYRVEQVLVLQEVGIPLEQRRENAKYMDRTDDNRLTLITCWPEWVYTHRVIVIAKPA